MENFGEIDTTKSLLSKGDFAGYREKLAKRKPDKGIYRYYQEIAKQVCDYFGDAKYKEFGLWVGVAKRIGAGELKAKLDYIREKGVRNPKYLLAACRKSK